MTPNDGKERQPIFTLPGVVSALVGVMIAIYAAQVLVLDANGQMELNIWFAFIPLRISFPNQVPGGMWPLLWTPITHAFLHASWPHVLINSVWLAIFGSPVARRYGAWKFLIAFAISAVAGAALFTLLLSAKVAILVGASGGISGLTGMAVRFMFQPVIYARNEETGDVVAMGRKLASFREVLASTPARSFVLVWVGLNAVMPFLPMFTGGVQAEIAWQAHLGGFFAGFFMAPLFERRQK